MSGKSSIHWTDATWNPVTGCSRVSPGCEHCYAEALSLRFGRSKHPWGAQWAAENVVLHPERLDAPLHWGKPQRVFVNSMSDLFHERIPDEFIAAIFGVMAACPQQTFQVLTKRPERMLRWFGEVEEWTDQSREVFADDTTDWRRWRCLVGAAVRQIGSGKLSDACSGPTPWPLPNVWLGVSVEDQRRADERIPLLLQTPAAVRFVSYEPALGPVDFSRYIVRCPSCGHPHLGYCEDPKTLIDWIICGGESGPHHRPFDLDWARAVRDQCQTAGVAFFFKQGGGIRPGMNRELDGRLWEEYPAVTP